MSYWQFQAYLIPQSRFSERLGSLPDPVPAAQQAALHWDEQHQPPADYAARLSTFVAPLNSWLPGVQIWGSDLGNRVDVAPAKGQVQTILVWFDAREETPVTSFLVQIGAFARQCDAVFLTEAGHVLTPGIRTLQAALRHSPARRRLHELTRRGLLIAD